MYGMCLNAGNLENIKLLLNGVQMTNTVETFEELNINEDIIKGLHQLGYNHPSPIQSLALPVILKSEPEKKNLVAQAQAGTGKTAAFVISMLQNCDKTLHAPQAICLVPTLELAIQVTKVAEAIGRRTGISIKSISSFERVRPGQKVTEQLLVGTPATMLRMLDPEGFNAIDASHIKVLVMDEAERLLDDKDKKATQGRGRRGPGKTMTWTIAMIHNLMPDEIQTLMFSATYSDPVREFVESQLMIGANIIKVEKDEVNAANIKHYYAEVTEAGKYEYLTSLYKTMTISQTIIFVTRRATGIQLTQMLNRDGHSAGMIMGGEAMDAAERHKALEAFRKGEVKVLVGTDVIARGVDVPQTQMVVNYDMPYSADNTHTSTFVHRAGRSGRFGRKGFVISLITDAAGTRVREDVTKEFNIEFTELTKERLKAIGEAMEEEMGI